MISFATEYSVKVNMSEKEVDRTVSRPTQSLGRERNLRDPTVQVNSEHVQ